MNFSLATLNGIDITVITLVLLMSIKGFMNGFAKELIGFLGLIGGVFVASRAAEPIAKLIDSNLFHLENFAVLKLIGFLSALVLTWGIVSSIGTLFINLTDKKSNSVISGIFGFFTAGIKYFLIFALIISALFRSSLIKDNIAQNISKSKLYPTLDRVGSSLINLAPIGIDITTKNKKI